jgi:ATP-dependent Clp protease adaptor protein ClpS
MSNESDNAENNSKGNLQHSTGIDVETVNKIDTPRMYKAILLNDDFTPMEFVILVLQRFFAKKDEEAQKIMLDVHKKGSGIAGVYTLEVAEMKVMQVNQYARMQKHPLKCTLEAE